MIRTISLIGAVCSLALAWGCADKKKDSQNQNPPISTEAPAVAAERKDISKGESLYALYCVSCHQAKGNGVPGLIPPLNSPEWVEQDADRLISLTINGMSGPITVNGEEYDNVMPPHAFLSDQEVAEILTYIRSNFGNSAVAITTDQVRAVRAKSGTP